MATFRVMSEIRVRDGWADGGGAGDPQRDLTAAGVRAPVT